MTKSKNTELWDQVFTTDTQFTKSAKKGAYQFTSITPMHQKHLATKALGPQGIGWGVEPDSEVFEYKEVGTTTLLIYKAVMFFKFGGELGRIAIAATEKLCYQTQGANGYLKIDDEADKKVKTAALTKGLSEIGVCADIHMGLHENYEYAEYASAKLKSESGSDEELVKLQEDFKSWFDTQTKAIALIPNVPAIITVTNRLLVTMKDKLVLIKATPEQKQAWTDKLTKISDRAIAAIENKGKS